MTDGMYSLSKLQKAVVYGISSLSTIHRSIELSLENFDERKQYLVECIYRELCKYISDFIVLFLEPSSKTLFYSRILDNCLKPLQSIPSECQLQSVFYELYKINSSHNIEKLKVLMELNQKEQNKYISEIFDLFKILIEDIYISVGGIDFECNDMIGGCQIPDSDMCNWNDRHNNIILYYTNESRQICELVKDYTDLCKRRFKQNTLNFIIDYSIAIKTSNSTNVNIDCDYNKFISVINECKKVYNKVIFRNTRLDKLKFPQIFREYIISQDDVIFS